MAVEFIKLDNWCKEIIVDPLSKEPLSIGIDDKFLLSPYGRKYPIVNGIFDLRLLNNETTKDQKRWKEGQIEYENWSQKTGKKDQQDYFAEIDGVKEIYQEIPVEGCCLDVGGHQGRLRHFIAPNQKYISCDPFMNVFSGIDTQHNLIKAYQCLLRPVNFVCCDAEFLPFRSCSFQTVHMRSVIDHFLNPELALNEAYRVLDSNGNLIIGLCTHGGKRGRQDIKACTKDYSKVILSAFGFNKFKDHHVWHPTYNQLTELIANCGFGIDKVHWQKGFNDTVVYIRAKKSEGLKRKVQAHQ